MKNALVTRFSYVLVFIVVGSFALNYVLQNNLPNKKTLDPPGRSNPPPPDNVPPPISQRIISLAPSTTEILFALGLNDQIVGVTRYCNYPPEAKKKARVGGYYDPNYEAIVTLHPDLVVTLPEHSELRDRLHNLGLQTLTVDHRSLSGILDSIATIGEVCGAKATAQTVLKGFRSRVERVRQTVSQRKHPTVLVSLGRQVTNGFIHSTTVCGPGTIYDDLIEAAGGVNAYSGEVHYPRVSVEGILTLSPNVVIDLVSDMINRNLDPNEVLGEWASVPKLSAYSNNRVYVLDDDYVIVPGPRLVLLLEDFARAIHPEAEWEAKAYVH